MKHGRYSVDTVSWAKRKDLRLDWLGVTAIFEVIRPSGGYAFARPVYQPAQIKNFEPDRVREREDLG